LSFSDADPTHRDPGRAASSRREGTAFDRQPQNRRAARAPRSRRTFARVYSFDSAPTLERCGCRWATPRSASPPTPTARRAWTPRGGRERPRRCLRIATPIGDARGRARRHDRVREVGPPRLRPPAGVTYNLTYDSPTPAFFGSCERDPPYT